MSEKLNKLRKDIDKLDAQIQELITKRAILAKEVAQAKNSVEDKPNFYRPEREAEVLSLALERNQGPLSDNTIILLFKEIMSACLALQKPLKISFLGPAGSYSQTAVFKHFGQEIDAIPARNFNDIFYQVEAGHAKYGVVPIENSTEGGIKQVLDIFVNTPLKICGEIELRIHHCLLSKADNLNKIKRIYSHEQSLGQCRNWLNANLNNIECIALSSNSEAAKQASNDIESAAIAGKVTAEIYNLNKLATRIEDNPNNITRFAIIGHENIQITGKDKTSFLVSGVNESGSLHALLAPFAINNINMTRIESRPSHNSVWDYIFFIDIEGHIDDEKIKTAVKTLEMQSAMLKHLGSYPTHF
jgi:chorismate mutase/prephenate dehydratase